MTVKITKFWCLLAQYQILVVLTLKLGFVDGYMIT